MDDAFISFRYAHNLANGDGLRFNATDTAPVEGFSNFLWVIVSSIFEFFGMDITLWSHVVSVLCGIVLIYCLYSVMRNRLEFSIMASLSATMLVCLCPAFAVWSTSGLETMPFSLMIFVLFCILYFREGRRWLLAAGLLGLCVSLMRAEGFLWAMAIPLTVVIAGKKFSREEILKLWPCYAVVIAFFAVFELWRYLYFDSLLPNTVYAKVRFGGDTLLRGLKYVTVQFLTFVTLFLTVPAAYAALKKRASYAVCCVIIWAAFVLYSVLVGGDFMTSARFLVPGLAFFAIPAGFFINGIVENESGLRRNVGAACVVIVIFLGILPAWNVHVVSESIREKFDFRNAREGFRSEYEQWVYQRDLDAILRLQGRYLKKHTHEGESIVCSAIGAVGYYSGLHVYDRFGLVDRDVRNRRADSSTMMAGHDRVVSYGYFLDRKPDIIIADFLPESMLESRFDNFSSSPLSKQYAPVMEKVDSGIFNEPAYLIMMRRLQEGTDPADAWKRARQRLKDILM